MSDGWLARIVSWSMQDVSAGLPLDSTGHFLGCVRLFGIIKSYLLALFLGKWSPIQNVLFYTRVMWVLPVVLPAALVFPV